MLQYNGSVEIPVILVVESGNANYHTKVQKRTRTNEQKLLYPMNKWYTDYVSPVY